jgi:hypothetical protein
MTTTKIKNKKNHTGGTVPKFNQAMAPTTSP